MKFMLIFFLGILSYGASKINSKALTESMGQEVIEIGTPLKELPPDLEEEPSAEVDDDKGTSTTLQTATARENKKESTKETRRIVKDIDKLDNVKQENDEARIEKELAEMYKDTDYKADSAEGVTEVKQTTKTEDESDKPVARIRDTFKFQPNDDNPRDIERFRTSIDDINCGRNKLVGVKEKNSGYLPTVCRLMFWGFFILI